MEEPIVDADDNHPHRRRRRGKGKGKDISSSGIAPVPPSTSVEEELDQPQAGSSKLPLTSDQEVSSLGAPGKVVTKRKKSKDRHKLGGENFPGDPKFAEWECIPIARNDVSSVPPIWSKDGKFFHVVSGTSIHIHSYSAPHFPRLSTLSSTVRDGHQKPITALILSPINPFQLITASLDGTVKIWDWVEGRLVRTIPVVQDGGVHQLCAGQVGGSWWLFLTTSTRKASSKQQNGGLNYHIHRILLSPTTKEKTNISIVSKLSKAPVALFISPRNTYLVALAANKAYTFRLPSNPSQTKDWNMTQVKFVSNQNFTCGAFAPESLLNKEKGEEWFATGDDHGLIRLWHGLDEAFRQLNVAARSDATPDSLSQTDKRLPTTSLHWHAHAVSAIAFTGTGAQLLSVGEESVLVQWHLASGRREFVPRLGGKPIVSLSVRPGTRGHEEEWWVTMLDGSTVRVGSASGNINNVGSAIKIDPLHPPSNPGRYPLAVHPANGAVVLPSSHPSTLQFIDPATSVVSFDLEVAPSNRVSKRDETPLDPVAVEHVVFSPALDGRSKWMTTVEGRRGNDDEGGMVKTLKFWQWTGEKYVLNTIFPRPHGTSDVSSLCFSSVTKAQVVAGQMPLLVTTSVDGEAKVWHARQARKSEQVYWSLRSTFSYRSMPIYSASVSADSTILALAHGPLVTLWDLFSNVLLRVLDSGAFGESQRVGFAGPESRYLVCAGATQGLAVWDLLICETLWSAPTKALNHLFTSTSSSDFQILSQPGSKRTLITSFSPTTPRPLSTTSISQTFSAVCQSRNSGFIGISSNSTIYQFGPSISAKTQASQVRAVQPTSEKKLSIWQEMFGKAAFFDDLTVSELERGTSQTATTQASGSRMDIWEGPSHTLPPTGMLFDAFMDKFLSSRPVEEDTRDEIDVRRDAISYDVPMDETSDLVLPTVSSQGRIPEKGEMEELQELFRSFVIKPVGTPDKRVNGKVNGKPNGHTNHVNLLSPPSSSLLVSSNDEDTRVDPIPITPDTTFSTTNGLVSDDERVLTAGKMKGRGKKRRAPREDD
ncbi:hypothetical protein TREMEDRAFT_71675 [Tremella mesenterica DSM 1558]|uniref:uncharacterized protein n=1 Tax=Tremella mesenterica (strain ATCC 24925 / CBS 8224 / DSM 1558 / NBRC 9311 / NRRL Y-6157 / RJB 2259-6 / UBC 559-6) TaxID=578456 RepID=UPI0003F49990|nr:uncharacterized protein TREMEDRAFT_71675 [Tremella mesenterica DSM 1558]EIW69565.1 hypothetical protein TREMEDRAFT_71675 [Tremella mesenterica DSM 1558]